MNNVYSAFDFSAPGFIQLLIRKAHPPRACSTGHDSNHPPSHQVTAWRADDTDRMNWGAVAAATTFESLAVASRPLQRRPGETIFYFTTKHTKVTEILN